MAQGLIRYRCFLPDLTGFTVPPCTGPNYQQSTSSLAQCRLGGEGGILTLGTGLTAHTISRLAPAGQITNHQQFVAGKFSFRHSPFCSFLRLVVYPTCTTRKPMSDCIRSCGRKARQGSKVCVQCAERTYQRDYENGRVQQRRKLRPMRSRGR